MKVHEQLIVHELLEAAGIDCSLPLQGSNPEIIEFSGKGYFVTLEDPGLPNQRIVLDKPVITGKLGGIEVGYLAIVEGHQLLLDCYSVTGREIKPKERDQEFIRDVYPDDSSPKPG